MQTITKTRVESMLIFGRMQAKKIAFETYFINSDKHTLDKTWKVCYRAFAHLGEK